SGPVAVPETSGQTRSSGSNPVLCLGHSHLMALNAGHSWHVRKNGANQDDMRFVPLNKPPYLLRAKADKDSVQLDSGLTAAVEALLADLRPRAVVLLLGGNAHNVMGLF